MLSNGATVVAVARNKENLERLKQEISNPNLLTWQCDVSDYEDVKKCFEWLSKELGKLDILVNNAGITRDTLLIRAKPEDWAKVISVNLTGIFNMCQIFTRMLMKSKGCIINISSVIGLKGNVGQTSYAASKAGIIGFTKSLARELARKGVRANVIAPGYIETDMTESISESMKGKFLDSIPMGFAGKPEDVAGVVIFLASEASRYITGEVIRVDGGMAM